MKTIKPKFSIIFFLALLCLFSTNLSLVGEDLSSDQVSIEEEKENSRDDSRRKQLREELQELRKRFEATRKELMAADKEIDSYNKSLVETNKVGELNELQAAKSATILRRIEIEERLEDEIREFNRKKEELSQLKENYIKTEGTYNWQKIFDISNTGKYRTGKWHISVKARDNMDNYSEVAAINIKIDPKSDIPQLNIINPKVNDRVSGNLKVVGTAFDDDAIDYVALIIDKDGQELICNGKEFWSYDVDTSSMEEGDHHITVRVVDINGVAGKEQTVTFRLDRKTPESTLLSEPKSIVGKSNITINGKTTDGNGISLIEYSTDNRASFKKVNKVQFASRERKEASWEVIIDPAILEDGLQTIWIRATDSSGSEGFLPVTFAVDIKKPIVNIQYPEENSNVDSFFTLFGAASDNVGIKKITVNVSSGGRTIKEEELTVFSANSFFSQKIDLTGEKNGKYRIAIKTEDMSGNIIEKSLNVNVDSELDKPVLTLESFHNGDKFTSLLPIYGRVGDDEEVKEVMLKIIRKDSGETVLQESLAAEYSYSRDVDLADFEDGLYSVELFALDIDNTAGNTVTGEFVIDKKSPAFDLASLNQWAGKVFGNRLNFSFNVIKYGPLRSAGYTILSNDYSELVPYSEVKLKSSATPGLYESGQITVDFDKNKIAIADGPALIRLEAIDEGGKKSSILVPLVFDRQLPQLTAGESSSTGSISGDEEVEVSDNLHLERVLVSITSSDNSFPAVNSQEVLPGGVGVFELKLKSADGKLNSYNITLEAYDRAGNLLRRSYKAAMTEGEAEFYKLLVKPEKRDNTILGSSPILYFAGKQAGLDEISSAIYAFLPDTAEELSATYGGVLKKFSQVNRVSGIYLLYFTAEERNEMAIGEVATEIRSGTNEIASLSLFNDRNAPNSSIIWPLPYTSFNDTFTIYGRASDDSGRVKVEYLLLESIAAEIEGSIFENDIMNRLNSKEERDDLLKVYSKDSSGLYRKNEGVDADLLLRLFELLIKAGVEVSFEELPTEAYSSALTKKISVPYLDPLKRKEMQSLADFITDNRLTIGGGEQLFSLEMPLSRRIEGSSGVIFKITDSAGKSVFQQIAYSIDRKEPEIKLWTAANRTTPEEVLSPQEEKKSRKERKSKKQNNEDLTGDNNLASGEEPGSEESESREQERDERERVSGVMIIRGEALDESELAKVVVIYNGREVIASGKNYWETVYNLNFVQGLPADPSGDGIEHTIELFAIDMAGNKKFISKEIIIDKKTDAPNVYIHNPSIENQRYTGIIELSGLAMDDDGVEQVEYRIINDFEGYSSGQDKKGWQKIDINPESGKWNITIDKDRLPSGKHILEVQATDIFGQKSEISRATFHLDVALPLIKINSPANGVYLRGDFSIQGEAFDQNDIQRVEISTNYGWSFVSVEGTDQWRYNFNSRYVPDGDLNVLIKARDEAGSEGYAYVLYHVDNTPPELSVLTPRPNGKVNFKYRISGRAKDNIGIKAVELFISADNQKLLTLPGGATGFIPVIGSESWYYDIDTTAWDTSKSYHLIVRVTDLAGNTTDETLDFFVDPLSDLPVVEVDQPQQNQLLTGEVIKIAGTAFDDDLTGLEAVYLRLNDGEPIEVKGTNIWSYSLPTVNLQPGHHKIEVYTVEKSIGDQEGKKSELLTRDFYFAESGPVVTVDSHINGAPVGHRPWMEGRLSYYERDLELKLKRKIQEERYYKLRIKHRDNPELIPEIEEIEVKAYEVSLLKSKYLRENRVKAVYLSINNGKTYKQYPGIIPRWRLRLETQDLPDGAHLLQIKSVSQSKKESIQYFKIALDREIPEVKINIPRENQKFNGELVVKGDADDNGQIEEVQIAFNRYDKNLGKLPKFIQGFYLWTQIFSGPWVSGGFGLTFFDDIVRVEGAFGWVPTRENMRDMGTDPDNVSGILNTGVEGNIYNPRYSGFVTGGKLLARIFDLPFEFFGGEDAKNFSISVEIGCVFYWYSGFGGASSEVTGEFYNNKRGLDEEKTGYDAALDGKVVAGFLYQIDFFKVERFGPFRKFALYFENSFYFVASEIKGGLYPQVGFGIRNAIF